MRGPIVALATLVATSTFATPSSVGRAADPDAVKLSLPVRAARLSNGLEVVLSEDHHVHIVAVSVWYHVGSKDEPAGHGFAHLFEHLTFEGSKRVPEEYHRYLSGTFHAPLSCQARFDHAAQ